VYHLAATVGPWTMTLENAAGDLSVSAAVVSADTYRVSQQPLVFVVPRGQGSAWRWPVKSLQVADGRLTASLGPQE